ncbi:5189_t:CDS:2, partial [Cetraspora pellucida]
MSENIFSYKSKQTKIFDTSNENIKVTVEGINGDIVRIFLVDKNDKPYESMDVVFMNLSVDDKQIFMLKQRKEQIGAI